MTQLVLGLGEVGSALLAILREGYGTEGVEGWDRDMGFECAHPQREYAALHICFPWQADFHEQVEQYRQIFRPDLCIIHSTVPIGTTVKIPSTVHSPVLGKHPEMAGDMRRYLKWIGGPLAAQAEEVLAPTGFRTRCVPSSDWTEALKLLDLAKYGVSIAFAHYTLAVCDKIGMPFSTVIEYDVDYNNHVEPRLKRPLIAPLHDRIGGHCVTPGVRLLDGDFPHELLKGILRYG